MSALSPPWYYRLLISLAKPFYRLWLFSKKKRLAHYKKECKERFGQAYTSAMFLGDVPVVWCHAVSLGELNTAYPLLKALLDDGYRLYISSTTQTGFARVPVLFAKELEQGTVRHGFVPIDDRGVIERFLDSVQPALALFVETELWATTLYCLKKRQIPSALINARLKDNSYQAYHKFAKLSQSLMANLSLVIAQDERSFTNFLKLGLPKDRLVLADSLKWSQSLSSPVLNDKPAFGVRPVWLAASTHEGEEMMALLAHQAIKKTYPTALLVIVPRHPERFDAVHTLCQSFGQVARRSHKDKLTDDVNVYLADTMGELMGFYDCCQVALVGGSLIDGVGGHNPIEPASLGIPVLMGRFVKSCEVLVAELSAVGACRVIDEDTLAQALIAWLGEEGRQAGQAGQALFLKKQHAYLTQKAALSPLLPTLSKS